MTLVLAACALLALAPAAWGHAQLLGTSPAAGSTVPSEPQQVIFKFNQNVGGTLGAVRVYDAQGNQVDDLNVSHPDGNQRWMGVGLKPKLPDGTYTATYRVISADTHIVYGGLVFSIGHPGAAPKYTVAGLIGRNRSGKVTAIAFGVVRTLDYLTMALMVGALAFSMLAWLPALEARAGEERRWRMASRSFASRLGRLLAAAVVLGVLASVLGILLQGASAAGVSLWGSFKGSIVENTLESRFGKVWGLRAVDWILIGGLLLVARATGRGLVPTLGRPSSGSASGETSPGGADPARAPSGEDVALVGTVRADRAAGTSGVVAMQAGPESVARVRRPPAPLLVALVLCCAYLVITPALAGHASTQSPTAVFFPADVLHVLAASVWVGGIACLLLSLPCATRQLEGSERTRLLLGALARFSPLALGAVIAIAVTGTIQAYIDVRSVEGLLHTTYGALVVAKVVFLLILVGFGWANRERVIPALRRIAGEGGPPAGAGAVARRSMRAELALMVGVLGVTAALITYAPPIDAASGPVSINTTLGPAELEMTVEPARVGLNTVHLYLIDAKTGVQFTATKELTVTARLPSKHIGPLPLKATLAGPGHYVLNSAVLSPAGTWELEILDRVSEFQQYTRVVKVSIR